MTQTHPTARIPRPLAVIIAIVIVAASAVTAGAAEPGPAKHATRSIVFILIDDMRYDAVGAFGNPYWHTPRIDDLARGGIWFENAFVTTSLCSPSRASILTGLYAHRHRVMSNAVRLDPSLPTFPREVQQAGYRTAFIGKWHMGGSSGAPRPGFDRWVSFKGQGRYNNPTLNVDGKPVKTEGYVTDLITDYAEAFLRTQTRDRPFLLYVSHKAVHADFQPMPRHEGAFKGKPYPYPESMADTEANYQGKPEWVREQRDSWHGVDGMYNNSRDLDTVVRQTAEALMAVDESVGRIVAALKERGLLDSTLIVFTSDNGFQFGEHGLIDKRVMYEASIRVPLIAHCPELIPAGRRCDEMILNVDFAPTFIELAGRSAPNSMHGRSFAPLLRGEQVTHREDFLYEYFWERSFPQTPTVLGVRTKRYKFIQTHGVWDRYELYDLQKDPHERHNLLGEFRLTTEAGSLDHLIARRAKGELKKTYMDLRRRLRRLQTETGCAPEPNWRTERR